MAEGTILAVASIGEPRITDVVRLSEDSVAFRIVHGDGVIASLEVPNRLVLDAARALNEVQTQK